MKPLAFVAFLALAAMPAQGGAQGGVLGGYTLTLTGAVQAETVSYDCGQPEPLAVTYINAAPNFLAIMPIDGAPMIFVSVVSASGAKYQAESFVWWSKGNAATLHNSREGLDAAPVLTCTQRVETP